MKLQSMTSFMDEVSKVYIPKNDEKLENEFHKRFFDLTTTYKEFLRQPLALGMFIAVDEEGNVLEEPSDYDYYVSDNEQYFNGDVDECKKYVEAQEKVLFKGFSKNGEELENKHLSLSIYLETFEFIEHTKNGYGGGDIGKTIESLANCNIDLELTPSALKQIGLCQH